MADLTLERPLLVQPSLARELGLEQALLYQLLLELQQLVGSDPLHLSAKRLETLLPFWDLADIDRVLRDLTVRGLLRLSSAPLTESGVLLAHLRPLPRKESSHGANAPTQPPTVAAIAAARPMRPRRGGANRIESGWQPNPEALSYLTQMIGVPREFIERELPEFISYWRDSGDSRTSWSSTFQRDIIRKWRQHQHQQHAQQQDQPISQQWRPSPDAYEILLRDGINEAFLEDAIPEFVLYWNEQQEPSRTWNSKFIAHVRRQWARYRQTLRHDTEPRPIHKEWQPDADVFDILRLANIDEAFARQQVGEFVLYWLDDGRAMSSWNTKFLQHVKYRWAVRHQLGVPHGTQQPTAGGRHETPKSAFERLTDRSWAQQILDQYDEPGADRSPH